MSKIALEGNASGTGTFTIASPNSNSNYTLTLPSSTGTVVVTGGAQTIEFAAGSAASPSITFTGDTNTGIFSPAADTIAFAEGGAEAMRITSAGDVGVGTTSPNLGGVNKAITLNSAAGTNASYELSINGTFIGSMYTNTADSSLRFGGWQNAPMVFLTNSTERMRITSSGNVGIGTTTPLMFNTNGSASTKLLTIYSTGTGAATRGELQIGSAATGDGELTGNIIFGCGASSTTQNSVASIYSVLTASSTTTATGALLFATANAGSNVERARITSGGALCVGGTGNIVSSSEILSVSGITGIGGTGSTTLYRLYVSNAAGSNATSPMIRFSTTDGIAGTIISTTTSTTYATSSDYRLKENIAPMTGALDKVAQLNPVTYNWKSNGSASQGFIAHELQAVCPDAVTGKKDETEIQQIEVSPAVPATYDEDGNELTPAVEATYEEREVPVYQGVDTSFLVATLTAAIQELKAITDAQATRIEALEAEVAALKGQ